MRLLRVAPDGAHAYVEIADGPRTDDEEKEAIRVACGFPQGSDLIYYHRDKDKNCLFTFFCFSGRWLNPYMTVVLSEQSYFRELTFQQLLGIKGPVVVKKAVGGRVEEATFADFMRVYEEAFADLAESPIKCITRSFYCYLASLNKRIDMMSCDSFFETAPSCALDACTRLVLNRILVPRLLGQRPESETPEEKIARETVKEYEELYQLLLQECVKEVERRKAGLAPQWDFAIPVLEQFGLLRKKVEGLLPVGHGAPQ